MVRWTALGLALPLLVAGCGSSSEEQAASDPVPTLTVGGCGLEYELLPAKELGRVVSAAELESERRSAATIDGLLAFAGLSSLSPVSHGAQVFELRYTTQDRGQRVEATGMVAVPWNEQGQKQTAPMLLELHGTTGFTGPCAPSAPDSRHDTALALMILASQGYVVVAPDYIGLDAAATAATEPHHAYLVSEQVALGSLDMLRATERLLAEEASVLTQPTRELLLWGASQGGHAVFASELYAPYYAPEYDVKAAVALIPATDLLGLAQHGLTQLGATTVALAGAMVTMDAYYSSTSHLSALLTDQDPNFLASSLPGLMETECVPTGPFEAATSVSDVFLQEPIDRAAAGELGELDPWGCYLSESSFATTSVKRHSSTPFLFVLGENDDLVIPEVERADFRRLCDLGYEMQYLECAEAGHVEAGVWSIPEQVAWMAARTRDEPLDSAALCSVAAPVACSARR